MDFITGNIFQTQQLDIDCQEHTLMDIDEVACIMTPPTKRRLPSLVDEDSGLGMDLDEQINSQTGFSETPKFTLKFKATPLDEMNISSTDSMQQNENGPVRRSLFNRQKRTLAAENQGSYSKRQQQRKTTQQKSVIKKSLSFGDSPIGGNDESFVKSVVNRLVEDQNLTGDGSQPCCLPTVAGKHSDLKSVSRDTVADLLAGSYDDVIGSYRLFDCRYPYEYEGGHVKGAENVYKQTSIQEILHSRCDLPDDGKRHVLIFYCEFSSERGPKMCRKLRSADRELNKDNYPKLNFPEVYIMHNGYKEFYEKYQQTGLCTPDSYKPMLHKDHSADLRHFRAKSKSWSSGQRRNSITHRLNF